MVNTLFEETLQICRDAFTALESKVPPPRKVPLLDGFVFRYTEQTLEQAIVQKLSRIISGLEATRVLLAVGLYQEVGILFRVLDELLDDVTFLCQPMVDGKLTDLHQEYLNSFYEEEFDDPKNPMASKQKRATVSRKKIHAALAAISHSPINPSDSQELRRTIGKMFSGFVHAASEHIMDSYGGFPPRYHLSGMLGTPRQFAYENEALHYFYRGFSTVAYVAVCFKSEDVIKTLYTFRDHFEKEAQMTDWPNADNLARQLRKGDI